MDILEDAVMQLEINQSNELALQAQINALTVDLRHLQEQQQRLLEALTQASKLRHLLPQGHTSS